MSEKRVVLFRNRGAIVHDYRKLLFAVPGSVAVPLDCIGNETVYMFTARFQGLSALKWAEFWLKKPSNRTKQAGTLYFNIRKEPKVDAFGNERFDKEFRAEGTKPNRRVKIKKTVGGYLNPWEQW